VHAHCHRCQVNSSASMSCAMHLPRVAVQLKFTMTASETSRQANSHSDKLAHASMHMAVCLHSSFQSLFDCTKLILSKCVMQAKCEWGLTPSQESLITSVVFVGTMSGAYAWGSLGDAKGRKLGFFATALFTFTFGVLSAVAPSYGASLPTSMQVPSTVKHNNSCQHQHVLKSAEHLRQKCS